MDNRRWSSFQSRPNDSSESFAFGRFFRAILLSYGSHWSNQSSGDSAAIGFPLSEGSTCSPLSSVGILGVDATELVARSGLELGYVSYLAQCSADGDDEDAI
jgi:hypothetical protein